MRNEKKGKKKLKKENDDDGDDYDVEGPEGAMNTCWCPV